MNLFGELRKENAQRTKRMQYGIQENVVLKGVDINTRFKKDTNVPINALLWIQYSQLDAEGNEIATAEQMVFNLDPNPKTDEKNTKRKIWSRDLGKFDEILLCYYTKDQIDGLFNQIFTQMGINSENFEGALGVPDNMKKFCEILKASIHAALTPVSGPAGEKLRLKITYDKQGYPQVATFSFVELASVNPSGLAMGDYDAKMKAQKEQNDAKKQAEAIAGKVGGPGAGSGAPVPGNAAAAPPASPAATPVTPAATPATPAAIPATTSPVAAPVAAAANPIEVKQPFTEGAPAVNSAPITIPAI